MIQKPTLQTPWGMICHGGGQERKQFLKDYLTHKILHNIPFTWRKWIGIAVWIAVVIQPFFFFLVSRFT